MKVLFEVLCWCLLITMMIFYSVYAHSDNAFIHIVVIDTGLQLDDSRLVAHVCLDGNKDLTGKGIQDDYGHGTHVVGLIEKYAADSNYCISMIKYTEEAAAPVNKYMDALKDAILQKPDIINLSVSGVNFIEEERELICGHPEIAFVVAAGNEGNNLDIHPIYPAALGCSNITTVGSKDFLGSNYGTMVHVFESGLNVISTLPNNKEGPNTGTSMSAAIASGKLVYEKSHKHP